MIKLFAQNSTESKLGKDGLSQSDLAMYDEKVKSAKKSFLSQDLGFKRLPIEYSKLLPELHKSKEFVSGKKNIVVIGIGGSDLGTRAVHRAINSQYFNLSAQTRLFFAGDTTDPESLSDLLEVIDLEESVFFVVSKSGNTIEQASTFVFLRDLYVQKKLNVTDHFIFITDAKTGTLNELANRDGYKTIAIPSDVGGRFSVLSSVGMVPSHLVGVDVAKMLQGAADLQEHIESTSEDIVFEYVKAKFAYYKAGKKISIMMPYQYSLFDFAKWYQQLWAESLGKKQNLKGEIVNEGQTPAAVIGPVDQHSQLQLYNEGPNDKFFTFIRAEDSRRNLNLPENYTQVEEFEFLKGRDFQEILNFEQETTAFALTKNGRPNVTISIPIVDEYHLGQLFYFFEVAVTYFGNLLEINTFDQPGVEISKNAMYGVLGKNGYENEKKEFEIYKV